MPRIHCPSPLHTGAMLALPPAAARHVQVLRMQPGDTVTLFNGGAVQTHGNTSLEAAVLFDPNPNAAEQGGEFSATITRMGRSEVLVEIGAHDPVEREAPVQVHLAVGMPANERMDWLVEKATELGVASIQPLVTERTVLRLSGERAAKKQAHWQAVAVAACEQCGRNQVPMVHEVRGLEAWMKATAPAGHRLILSLQPGMQALQTALSATPSMVGGVVFLSGPEGGLSPAEEAVALAAGYQPVTLGARTLRAETAALAALVMACG